MNLRTSSSRAAAASSAATSCTTWSNNHPDVHVTVLDKLTYAGNPENIAGLPSDRVELVVGDICDAGLLDRLVPGHDAIVHYAAESHNDNSIADPEPFLRTNVEGTFRLLEAVRKHGIRYHHVSTDEVYGDLALDDPAQVHRGDAVPPVLARTRAPRRAPTCSCAPGPAPTACAPRSPTAPTTTAPTSTWRSSSPGRSPTSSTACAPSSTAAARTSATGSTPRTTPRAVWDILTKGRMGETYLIGADGEKNNITVLRMILEAMGTRPRGLRLGRRPPRPRPPLRHRLDQAAARAGLEAGAHRLRRGPQGHHRLVRRERVLVAPGQGGHRGALPRTGPVRPPARHLASRGARAGPQGMGMILRPRAGAPGFPTSSIGAFPTWQTSHSRRTSPSPRPASGASR